MTWAYWFAASALFADPAAAHYPIHWPALRPPGVVAFIAARWYAHTSPWRGIVAVAGRSNE
jgi:hypothetical protein